MTTSGKRANFASIQASHVIPMKEMKSNRVLTGAEATIASKVGKPFVFISKDYGVVEKIDGSKVTIKHSTPKDGNVVLLLTDIDDNVFIRDVYDAITTRGYSVTTDDKLDVKYRVYIGTGKVSNEYIKVKENKFLGSALKDIKITPTDSRVETYSLKSWSSKIEGGTSIKHNMTTNLRVGDKVEPDQVVVYDSGFFEPNIYDSKSVVLRMGSYGTVAFVETKTTYEDSIIFNSSMLEKTGETKYKIVSKVLDVTSHITNVLPEKTEVRHGDKLMTIMDINLMDSSLSDRARDILSDVNDSSPKANGNGIIDRIDVIYNCELEDMDQSIRILADISNKRFKEESGVDGRVTSEYSIYGIPLMAGQIELKYYVVSEADTKIGDKFIIGHQLKNTVGDVLDDIKTESGESIDMIFSNRSVLARITNSGYIIGTTNLLMKHFTDKAIKAYRS